MNYEQKYKEALKVIGSLYNVVKYQSSYDASLTFKMLEKAFPELKENEDEKWRNWLIGHLKGYINQTDNKYAEVCKKAIEWLEKQGEKMSDQRHGILDKLIEADNIYQMAMNDAMVEEAKNKAIEALSKLGISKLLWLDKQGEQSKQQLYDIIIALWDLLDKIDTFADLKINDTDPNNPFRKIEHLTQERHRFVKSDGYNLFIDDLMITNEKMEKQGEQKPNFCHHEVDLSDCSEEYRKAYYDGWNNCNQQYVQLEAEQKTAWSEEDEKMLEDTISCLSAYQSPDISKGLCYQEQIDWLKSLKPQPKQEWSEEDEAYSSEIIGFLKNYIKAHGCTAMNSWVKWLESLKPNHWKPSEEQMEGM